MAYVPLLCEWDDSLAVDGFPFVAAAVVAVAAVGETSSSSAWEKSSADLDLGG